MGDTKEKVILRNQLENACRRDKAGYFDAYCHLHNYCTECNRWVRLLCKIKLMLEKVQTAIILHVCKE